MRYSKIYPASLCFCVFLAAVGVMLGDPAQIIPGIRTIILMEDALITDYIQIAGISAAFVNSALVTLISVGLLWLCREAPNGFTMVELGLMAGFALFGKNIANIWPIIAGTFLYAKVRREPFGKYVSIALLATALAPVVSYVAIDNGFGNLWWGIGVGVLIGFVLPPLSAYTYKIQNGMNLYNMGFACGVLAMILVPVMSSLGADPNIASHWSTGNNLPLALALGALCAVLILTGLFLCGRPAWAAWAGYRRLLLTTGRAPSDYLRMFGAGPTLVNMGVNGLIGMAYIFLVGGDLNGPTLGGIFTIMGFGGFGKHALNILPVMAGVYLGAYGMHYQPDYPTLQLAGLFGTTLAPIAGHFGWPYGVLAGFIHSALVLQTSGPVVGLNLYNNGFSGGLIAIVLYPTITAIVRHRQPKLRDASYYDLFTGSGTLDVSRWRTHNRNSSYRRVDEKVGPYGDMPDDEDIVTMDDISPPDAVYPPESAKKNE